MTENDDALGVPEFARIEIALVNRDGLLTAALKLRELAADLEAIADASIGATALLVAYRKIRATSKKLRG